MRKAIATISLLALLLAACGTSQPGRPSPTVLGTQAPAMTAQPAETEKPEDQGTPPPTPNY